MMVHPTSAKAEQRLSFSISRQPRRTAGSNLSTILIKSVAGSVDREIRRDTTRFFPSFNPSKRYTVAKEGERRGVRRGVEWSGLCANRGERVVSRRGRGGERIHGNAVRVGSGVNDGGYKGRLPPLPSRLNSAP